MLEWASPWAFVLLLPVLALPLQRRLTGVNRLAVASTEAMDQPLTARRMLAWLPAVLRIAGLALLVIALARPRLTQRTVSVESDGLDIMLAIDTSGSMEQEDLGGGKNRLEVAKSVMAEFIETREFDRIGLVVFGEDAFTHVPLTTDHRTLQAVLDHTRIGIAGRGSTAIGQATAVASKRLKDLDAPSKIVILLTDGRNNAGRIQPMEAAQAASALGIKVYTVGVGGNRRTFFRPFANGIDEETLTAIAETTGAKYYRATDTQTLSDIFAEIDRLEPSPAEVREVFSFEERFRWFLGPGLALLLLQVLLSATFLRRGP